MSMVMVVWTIWAILGLILMGLLMYRASITRYEEDQLFLDDAGGMESREQTEVLRKVKRIEPVIRLFGGAEGLVTLGIVAFYLVDAWHQF
jgi:hypothetical protein